jgi:N-acetyl-anhydromuramyl-L-alanine amidase AmpD
MLTIQKIEGLKPLGKYKNKKQIVLSHTSRNARDFVISLSSRYNGKNPYLPHFIILRDGAIQSIIPSDTHSKYLDTDTNSKHLIHICLENLGWLKKNPLTNAYVNWLGNIYNEGIVEKKWRNHFFWQPYTKEQMKSLGLLINELCVEFNIPKTLVGHNTKVNGVDRFEGIASKSNYDSDYTDLSPAFDFEELKKIIEDESI